MKSFSFRVKIIGMIVIVVTLFSVISFTVFNFYLKDKLITHTEETYNHMNLLRDQYYFTISQHDGKVIRSMLKNLEQDPDVLRTFLINSKRKLVYPKNHNTPGIDSANVEQYFSSLKDISIVSFSKENPPYSRVFIRLQNIESCQECHNPSTKALGLIVMDLSNHETQSIVNLTKNFSIFYTIAILLAIFTMVAYLHFKYIRKSMQQFRAAIRRINKGDLEKRLDIPEVRELGSLGRDFNEMMATFERTQYQLREYHEKELQNTQKLATIGEMSARIAHEIRNPVTGIARAMEVIITEMKDSANKPILEEIQRQANRVNQAITNLLRFSRTKELILEKGNINDILKSVTFFLQNQSLEKSVRFELQTDDLIPKVSFDHEQLENVIMNLIINSIQSIQEEGVIIIKSSFIDKKNKVLISISDNGKGIPEEAAAEIFKPFFTTRTKGTGLGLAISKDIIQKHEGEIWFKNNEDSGCTFFLTLPA